MQSNPQRQEAEWRSRGGGTRENGEMMNGYRILVLQDEQLCRSIAQLHAHSPTTLRTCTNVPMSVVLHRE